MTYSWPVVLKSEDLTLQALRFRDRPRWNNVRAENRDWLSPWAVSYTHLTLPTSDLV